LYQEILVISNSIIEEFVDDLVVEIYDNIVEIVIYKLICIKSDMYYLEET